MNDASSEARNSAPYATSLGSPTRFMKLPLAASAKNSSRSRPSNWRCRSVAGVSIAPGQTQLTRMLSGARSSARHQVSWITAPLEALYGMNSACATNEETDAMFTIAPPLNRRIDGRTSLTQFA